MDLQRRANQISNIRFEKGVDSGEAALKRKAHVLERKIPINPNQTLLAVTTEADQYHIEIGQKEINTSPERNYHKFMSFDQAGPATIAYDSSHNLYAIKKYKHDLDKGKYTARPFKKNSLVSIKDLFWRGGEIYIVYECMDISLQHILATPRGYLAAAEIAVIYKQVCWFIALLYLSR